MCCRYLIAEEDEDDILFDGFRGGEGVKMHGEIFPTDTVPVIARGKTMKRSVFPMRWGYRENGKLIFNSRAETLREKRIFRDGIERRRCLVPASAYFEWGKDDKVKYKITKNGGGMILFAGIYRFEDGIPVFSVITCMPDEHLFALHDRKPLILAPSCTEEWLFSENPETLFGSDVRELSWAEA